ncbi:MAG: GspE/PulE family protein [Patescibacteria group bacterium]|nr:GspE/PulE family protein [Patescibacteria group bacterium]
MHIPKQKFKEIVLNSGIVEEADYQKSQEEAKRSGLSIENVLIGNGHITEQYLIEILAKYLELPTVDLSNEKIKFSDIELISESDAKKKQLIIFGKEKGFVKVAMIDPLNLQAIEYVKTKIGMPVKIYITGQNDIQKAWKRYKKDIGKEFHEIIKRNVEKTKSEKGDIKKIAQDLPVISILDTILDYAIAHNSSDIHIEVFEEKVIVRYRIDGILRDIVELPVNVHMAIVARIKILSNLQIDEHLTPQDGRFKFKTEDQSVSIRVSIMPTFHGEKAVMRILSGSARPLSLTELGLSEHNLKLVNSGIKKTQGLILVTGPTGSGKTTTLYSILHLLNNPEVNICTIEDPIEYDIPRINQTQVNPKTGITFAEGLRSFLRQNPNIIMVGEIRDKETLEMAIHASLTGHLVLSTLHTNNAALAIPRLIDMGAEPFLISSTLNIIIAQRLVRKNCPKCLSSQEVENDTIEIIKEQLKLNPYNKFDIKTFDTSYNAKGCKNCNNSGYHGQIGIFETLKISQSIKDLIVKKSSGDKIKEVALSENMIPMFEDGLEKIQTGQTTITEILRAVRE